MRLYGVVGGAPGVLVFSSGDGPGAQRLAVALRSETPAGTPVLLIARSHDHLDGDAFLDDHAGVHSAYGIATDSRPTVVVFDANVRVAAVEQPDGPGAAANVAAAVAALASREPAGPAPPHAPVLRIPGALGDGLCDRLIEVWSAADPVATGVETLADGRHVEALDALRKRRRDHVVTDPELQRTLTTHIGRRVIPEVEKAFAFAAERFEGFKLGCYTADDAGFFEAHRDNLSPATAHRRFALSLNLNDDYDGGEVCFPEYGGQRYRLARGEALVFSGAHLHEVQPVTRGRRFVLLSFLF